MYIVVNRTREVINLKDLEWTIGPRRSVDLDKIRSRKQIDDSSDLRSAVKQGKVQIRHSSVSNTQKESNYIGPLNPSIKIKTPTLNDDYVEKIRHAIREEVENQFSKQPEQKTEIVNNVPPEMSQLLDQMKQFFEFQTKQPRILASAPIQDQFDDDIDMDKLSEIHAKSVGRLGKDASGQVKYVEQRSSENLDQNLDDLENLLGEE